MTRTREARRIRLPVASLNALDRIYASLPRIECQRKCGESCGPVFMSRIEWQRIIARVGRVVTPTPEQAESLTCPLLTGNDCSVYDLRPVICRLWGLVDSPLMRCPWGCVPERWLSDEEAETVLRAVEAAGNPDERSRG